MSNQAIGGDISCKFSRRNCKLRLFTRDFYTAQGHWGDSVAIAFDMSQMKEEITSYINRNPEEDAKITANELLMILQLIADRLYDDVDRERSPDRITISESKDWGTILSWPIVFLEKAMRDTFEYSTLQSWGQTDYPFTSARLKFVGFTPSPHIPQEDDFGIRFMNSYIPKQLSALLLRGYTQKDNVTPLRIEPFLAENLVGERPSNFKAHPSGIAEITIKYPYGYYYEKFPLKEPKNQATWNPLDEAVSTLKIILTVYSPYFMNNQAVQEAVDDMEDLSPPVLEKVAERLQGHIKIADTLACKVTEVCEPSSVDFSHDACGFPPPSFCNHFCNYAIQRVIFRSRLSKTKDKSLTYGEILPK